MSSAPFIRMTAPADVYRRRRAKLAAALKRPLLVFAGHAPARNYAANTYPFRAGSTYLYFGGPPLEGAALLIEPDSDGDKGCTLFRVPAGPDDDVWMGPAPADEALAAAAGIDRTHIIDADHLGRRVADRTAATVAPVCVTTHRRISELRLAAAGEAELLPIIHQRLIKDEHELAAMRQAAAVTVEAHRAAMAACAAGRREADAAAAFLAVLEARQCRPSFTPIVTVRGEVLHGQGYGNELAAGSLLLIDAGAEEPGGYASDVTRVCPVGGRFSALQRQLYDTVRRAMDAATAACTPRRRYREVHEVAARVICEGLAEADLLRGEAAELAGRGAHTLFFTHGVGHLIGLDVHDMEDFGDLAGYPAGRSRSTQFGTKFLRLDRDLAPGMTVTIEPGIYFVPGVWRRDELVGPLKDCINRTAVDKLLKTGFGGIRLENTVHVRPPRDGKVLTAPAPPAAAPPAPPTGRTVPSGAAALDALELGPEILSAALEIEPEAVEALCG